MAEKCVLAGVCSGCGWIGKSYDVQKRAKLDFIVESLEKQGVRLPEKVAQFRSAGEWRMRDRVDLTLEHGRLGLYGSNRELVDIQTCPMMSSGLVAWFVEFRKNLPVEVKKGSVRLRVSPGGQRGVWLDFANLDVKALFDDSVWLKSLLSVGAVVEIGQKRKRLGEVEGRLKLLDPQPAPWFETYLPEAVSLLSFVGGFTQPGFEANKSLVETVRGEFEKSKAKIWMELGSGIGNFTLPLANVAEKVFALELDSLSVEALSLNSKDFKNIEIIHGDYRNEKVFERVDSCEGVLCDPPRSGLGAFVEFLPKFSKNRALIYVSCFADSFAEDAKRLVEQGYELQALTLVDQFPQSQHVETVASFSKN